MAAEGVGRAPTPDVSAAVWVVFIIGFLALQAFFYFVFNKDKKVPSFQKALVQTLISIACGLLTALLLWLFTNMGAQGVGEGQPCRVV